MRQEKKNEELTSIDIGDDTSLQRRKSYIKNADEDLLQRPEKIQTRQVSTEQKYKIGRKTPVWKFQVTNKPKKFHARKLAIAKKVKPEERNWISSDSNTKQCHKDKLCQSKNRPDKRK